jgi:beta-lactamase class D
MKTLLFTIFLICFAWLGGYGQPDLSKPFRDCGLSGSFTLYNYKTKEWVLSDSADSYKPSLPASTFKILNTLIALEEGVVKSEDDVVRWPGFADTSKYGYRPEIYHDMSVREAFKVSAVWVYLDFAEKIGKEKYKKYLEASGYGNADVSFNDNDFWNFGSLGISPANQVKVLVGLYDETLPFRKESFATLKRIMVEEQTATWTLRAKTGWTRDGGNDTGWWVGYAERKDNVYFFATRLVKSRNEVNPNFGQCRKDVTKAILRQLGIID